MHLYRFNRRTQSHLHTHRHRHKNQPEAILSIKHCIRNAKQMVFNNTKNKKSSTVLYFMMRVLDGNLYATNREQSLTIVMITLLVPIRVLHGKILYFWIYSPSTADTMIVTGEICR